MHRKIGIVMKQQYAVVVLFALIIASSMVSLTSYKTTEKLVTEDVNQALAKALDVFWRLTPRKDSVHVRKYRQPRFCHSLTSVLR